MIDLWMQIEGTKLIFVRNFSVLHFFNFASKMPQIAQILALTFIICWGEGRWKGGRRGACPWTPTEISSFFFHEQFPALTFRLPCSFVCFFSFCLSLFITCERISRWEPVPGCSLHRSFEDYPEKIQIEWKHPWGVSRSINWWHVC